MLGGCPRGGRRLFEPSDGLQTALPCEENPVDSEDQAR
jgi:hypothetical protein